MAAAGRNGLTVGLAQSPTGKRRWTHVNRRRGDRELVLPRAWTAIVVSRFNFEGKAAGRSRRPGKRPTGSKRQSGRQTAAYDNERIRRSTAARCNGLAVRVAHGPVGKRRWTQANRRARSRSRCGRRSWCRSWGRVRYEVGDFV